MHDGDFSEEHHSQPPVATTGELWCGRSGDDHGLLRQGARGLLRGFAPPVEDYLCEQSALRQNQLHIQHLLRQGAAEGRRHSADAW